MKFAINYSPAADTLLRQKRISLDLYKCPDWPDLIDEARRRLPAYVHFPFRAGKRDLHLVDWRKIDLLLQTTGTRHVNVHLAPCASDFPGLSLESHEPHFREAVMQAMLDDIDQLIQRFGREHLILENVMWDPAPPWEIPALALEKEVIRDILQETGCGLLLDLAHARIAAKHFAVSLEDYLAPFPLDRLAELHITGILLDDNDLWQDHYGLTEEDWNVVNWALANIREGKWASPGIVAFEYGGIGPAYEHRTEPAVIATQVPRLYELVHRGM
ncbi:DUF692 family protein [bacterium]|nr:DUF692 family protein [bacterium]